MNKFIFPFLVLSIVSTSVFSQNHTIFGLEVGFNLSKLNDNSGLSTSKQFIPGYKFGGLLDVGLDNNFSIQPGFLISTKGGNNTYSSNDFGGTARVTLNYVEIPVNLLYDIPNKLGKFFFGGGPYWGHGLSTSSTTTGDGNPFGQTEFGNSDFQLNKNDLGINLIAGYQVIQGPVISINYGMGLANLSNAGNNNSVKNEVISISLGCFFK